MRLFFIGLGHMRKEQIDVARALQRNHEILYWVRMRNHFEVSEQEFPGTVFHDYLDALKGVPAPGVDTSAYVPWSAEAIASYADVETEFLTMVDKWYPDWSVNQRKDLYYDMLCYWGGVLDQFQPDCIIIPVIPHEMYSFVLYKLARRRGIRTIILDAVLDHYYCLVEDYTKGNEQLAGAMESDQTVTIDDLLPELRQHYETVAHTSNPAPEGMRTFIRQQTLLHSARRLFKAIIKFIKDGSVAERLVAKVFKMMKSDLIDERRTYEQSPDFTKPYVYLPLHYQPEATTSPQGGIYVEQLLMVKTVAAALPHGWELYVKEHPAQVGVHGGNRTPARYPGFYRTINAIAHTRLVPIGTNTFQLTDHAQTTATATGTAAWESIIRGKAALVFGYPWFMHAPGIVRVKSVEDCKRALTDIAQGFVPSRDDVLKYLYVVGKVACVGHLQNSIVGFENEWPHMHAMLEEALSAPERGSAL